MAGRGRGRGQATFSRDQIGVQKGEVMPGLVLQPPPLYPPMEHKPIPLTPGLTQERLVAAKRSLRSMFRESNFYVKADLKTSWITEMLASSGKRKQDIEDLAMVPNSYLCYFPRELIRTKKVGLGTKRKASVAPKKSTISGVNKAQGSPNVLEKLSKLEDRDNAEEAPKEQAGGSDAEGEDDDDETKERKAQQLNEDEEIVEDEDEEMDEGTDYARNYFDGGDDYADDADDDVDEGPIF